MKMIVDEEEYAKEFKILLIGLEDAGKTTLLHKLITGQYIETTPSTGFDIGDMIYRGVKFLFWDMSGRLSHRDTWLQYLKILDGIVFVIDASDQEGLECAAAELTNVLQNDSNRKPLLVYANKMDVETSLSTSEMVRGLGLSHLKGRQWLIKNSCAFTGDGLYEGIHWLLDALEVEERSQEMVETLERDLMSTNL